MLRRDPVEQRRAEPEAVGVAVRRRRRGRRRRAPRPRSTPGVDVATHLVAVRAGDQRAHVAAAPAVAGAQPRDPRRAIRATSASATGSTATTHRDRHAPLARRAEPGADRGVGGQVEVGVGQHHHVVLGPAERLHPLAVPGAGLVDVPRDRRRADEATPPRPSGCSSSASTASLSPCTTLKTPSGSPASAHSSASSSEADGSFSLGLSTTALPQAIATGTNHSGTMAGKLNGEITATTPSGWRSECTSTPVETPSLKPPLSRCGAPQANSTTSSPRCTSPSASSSTLPCSAVMASATSWRRREQRLAEREQHRRTPGERRRAPRPARLGGAASRRRRRPRPTRAAPASSPGPSPGRARRRAARPCRTSAHPRASAPRSAAVGRPSGPPRVAPCLPPQESKPSPARSSARSQALRRPPRSSARPSDHAGQLDAGPAQRLRRERQRPLAHHPQPGPLGVGARRAGRAARRPRTGSPRRRARCSRARTPTRPSYAVP